MWVAPLLRSLVTNVATLDTPVSVRLLGVSAAAGAESIKMLSTYGLYHVRLPRRGGRLRRGRGRGGRVGERIRARRALEHVPRPCACHPLA